MINVNSFDIFPPFSLAKNEKEVLLTEKLIELTEHHKQNCQKYKRILEKLSYNSSNVKTYYDIPFLPVRLFKEYSLYSIPDEEIFKTMTSSGTTGQAVSKIVLNKSTAANQQKVLVKLVSDFTGATRMPMLIIDSPSVIKNRLMFSARGAGILGFSIFGADRTYALDDDMKINIDAILNFLNRHKGQPILLFGFTFMIWQYFYKELKKLNNHGIDLSSGILIHGGGWKKTGK